MTDELSELLDALAANGYDSVERTEGYANEASGVVELPARHRRERPAGWRRFLPRIYDGGDPSLIPDDLRSVVEARGWTVQAVGRDATTVTVVVSEDGV